MLDSIGCCRTTWQLLPLNIKEENTIGCEGLSPWCFAGGKTLRKQACDSPATYKAPPLTGVHSHPMVENPSEKNGTLSGAENQNAV